MDTCENQNANATVATVRDCAEMKRSNCSIEDSIFQCAPATVANSATVGGYTSFIWQSDAATVANPATVVEKTGDATLAGLATFAEQQAEYEISRRASAHNHPSIFKPQLNPNLCHVCGERANEEQPFVAVMTPVEGQHNWLHRGCHDEHIRRVRAARNACEAQGRQSPAGT